MGHDRSRSRRSRGDSSANDEKPSSANDENPFPLIEAPSLLASPAPPASSSTKPTLRFVPPLQILVSTWLRFLCSQAWAHMSIARYLWFGKRSVSTEEEWRVWNRGNSPAAIGVVPPKKRLADGRWQELVV